MLERELQDWIAETAQILGWRVFHTRPARSEKGWRTPVSYDGKGFVDLVLVRDRVLFIEVKVGKNKPSPEQVAWARALLAAGQTALLWTEKEWSSGEIERTLGR